MRRYEPDGSLPDRDPTAPAEPRDDTRLALFSLAFSIVVLIVSLFAPYWINKP